MENGPTRNNGMLILVLLALALRPGRNGLLRPGTAAVTGRMFKILNVYGPWYGGTAPAPGEPPEAPGGPLSFPTS
jgi:hypothetical protein